MITLTLAASNPTPAAPKTTFVPRLLSSVGNDQTSYKGNQRGQVITFNLAQD